MRPFRLAVLSDLHVNREIAPGSRSLAKKAFDAAVSAAVDHVVLVGDVFDCATAMRRDQDGLTALLKRRGLWHRDRLSIVVGNHDIFHTPHYGSAFQRSVEFLKATPGGAQVDYEHFGAWVGALLVADDRLDVQDPFPFSKVLDHVRLSAIDTTESVTAKSSNGRLSLGDAARVAAAADDSTRHILAIHNAPEEGRATVMDSLKGLAGGYSSAHMERIKQLGAEAGIEAIVTGHLHATDAYTWSLGGKLPVYLMDRTGGMHETTPTIGILNVPRNGAIRWEEVEF